jgi:hypothetical protein
MHSGVHAAACLQRINRIETQPVLAPAGSPRSEARVAAAAAAAAAASIAVQNKTVGPIPHTFHSLKAVSTEF